MSPEPKPLKSNLKEGTEFLEECYPNLVGDKPNFTNYIVMDSEATLLHISQNHKALYLLSQVHNSSLTKMGPFQTLKNKQKTRCESVNHRHENYFCI